jgi:hypothetical protein
MGDGDAAKDEWILSAFGFSIPTTDANGGGEAETLEAEGEGGDGAAGKAEASTEKQSTEEAGQAAAPDWKEARQAWQDANDAVDGQINGLRAKLLDRAGAGDDGVEGLAEALKEIADAGLNGLTEDHRVKLIASVMSIGDGSPQAMQKSGPKALAQITQFQAFLDKSEMIAACDANPFGAPVSIKATLTPPLQQMAAALQAAAAP